MEKYSEKLKGLPLGEILTFLKVASQTLSVAIFAENVDVVGRPE